MNSALSFGYTGTCQDPVTCGYPLGNGYRFYFPELMRFSQPDDWSPFDEGGIHPYVYCSDDPINHSDPSGHVEEEEIVAELLHTILHRVEEIEAAEREGAIAAHAARTAARSAAAASEVGPSTSSTRPPEDMAPIVKKPRLEMSNIQGLGEPGPPSEQAVARPVTYSYDTFMQRAFNRVQTSRDDLIRSLRARGPLDEHDPSLNNFLMEQAFAEEMQTASAAREAQAPANSWIPRMTVRDLTGFPGEEAMARAFGFPPGRYATLRITRRSMLAQIFSRLRGGPPETGTLARDPSLRPSFEILDILFQE